MAGSMSRSGKAVTSKCDTDDPCSYGFGEYNLTCPAASAPAITVGSGASCTETGPSRSDAFRSLPAASVTLTHGIVIVGSAPPNPGGFTPATLFAMMTAIAPAACAFAALTTNPHVPRSMSAIFPAIGFTMASQPSLADGARTPSSTRMRSPVMSTFNGPNDAVPVGYFGCAGGAPFTNADGCGPRNCVDFDVTHVPFHTMLPVLIADAAR